MKKKIIFTICMILTICTTLNFPINAKTDESIKITDNYTKKEEESLLYSRLYPMWNYAEKNGIKLKNFKERKKVMKFMTRTKMNSIEDDDFIYLEKTGHLTSGDSYKKTLEETEFLYYGSLKDGSVPNGMGMILQIFHDEPLYEPQLFIRYIGQFKNGKYDGYGVDFNTESSGFDMTMIYNLQLLENDPNLLNDMIIHEGYYKKGYRSGQGITYLSDIMYYVVDVDGLNLDTISPLDLVYDINMGEFKNDQLHGKGKSYYNGSLLYNGGFKYGDYSGKGTLYYNNSNQILYKGEFSGGSFNGKGTLFDENGNIIHKGKFYEGDVA